MNSWLVTPIGLVDVTSRCQFRAAGLSMVVTPERRMSDIKPFREGLGLGRRDVGEVVEVVDEGRHDAALIA